MAGNNPGGGRYTNYVTPSTDKSKRLNGLFRNPYDLSDAEVSDNAKTADAIVKNYKEQLADSNYKAAAPVTRIDPGFLTYANAPDLEEAYKTASTKPGGPSSPFTPNQKSPGAAPNATFDSNGGKPITNLEPVAPNVVPYDDFKKTATPPVSGQTPGNGAISPSSVSVRSDVTSVGSPVTEGKHS